MGDEVMIKSIQRLSNFGIFQNHVNTNVKDFGRFNLFYGWNGSGKSTLSDIFRCIENKTKPEKFPSSEFAVETDSGTVITQSNITESELDIYTFNHGFIDENISWDDIVKSILLVDKAKIEEREKLEELKNQQEIDSQTHKKETEEIKKLDDAVSRFETDSARHMKTSLQSIDTTDNYYLNYDKRKLRSFITSSPEATKTDDSILDEDRIISLTNAAKPDQKSSITFTYQTKHQQNFTKAKERLDNLLKTSVVSKTIQRFVEHGDIKSWVETGLDLHKRHHTNQCEFCGNTITEERISQLEAHFNDDYKAFQDRLREADVWLENQRIQPPELPALNDFYEEFKEEYREACIALEKATSNLNKEISAWHTVLNKKTGNPLKTDLTIETISEPSIKAFNDAITAINSAVGKHNHKSANFQEETNKAKKQLELHYATTEIKNFSYHKKKTAILDRTTANNALETAIANRNTEIRNLEDSLSNESLGADQFNKSLHKFLGRGDLTLRFNPEKKGYEILRNDSEPVHGNLSEGEKTAIAFVYFITKIKENDNNIQDMVIVIDDPVSSFDSNHLFHAYSFMKMHCEKAKQLFILTHNFTFFKLVRDWISRKNKDNRNIANFYVINASNGNPRNATYIDAKPALMRYNSEYHYFFSRLYSLKEQEDFETDDYFLAANLSRRLLEAFLAFKFPKNHGNFAQLFDVAISSSENPGYESKQKILKFVNQYSHKDLIETNEDFVESQIGESISVISDIFTLIKELDENHYNEMIEIATS